MILALMNISVKASNSSEFRFSFGGTATLTRLLGHNRLLLIAILTFVANFLPPISGTTIDPFTWEELVLNADFVGIVECTTAGGIVAQYKIVDSWKGRGSGEELSLRIALNYWGGQFPVALVGQRFWVAAFKETPDSMVSTSFGGPVPLWWRQIPADYSTPLLQGMYSLEGEYRSLSGLGSSHESLDELKRASLELLALPPEEKEKRVLRGQAEKYLFDDRWQQSLPDTSPVRQKLAAANRVEELVEILQQVARQQKDAGPSYPVFVALQRGGREITLEIMEAMPVEVSPLGARFHGDLLSTLRRRLGKGEADALIPGGRNLELPTPTEQELATLRRQLQERVRYDEAADAILLLTKHDPALVKEYLLEWENSGEDWRGAAAGYWLGSYFAWKVLEERKEYLLSLLNACDPYIRVAAAVYLCFENEEKGKAHLRELSSLDGIPGVWAALTLARRGEKDSVEKILSIFRERPEPGEGDLNHYLNFEGRVKMLLSNSAAASGFPQPSPPRVVWHDREDQEKVYKYYLNWWREHREDAVLSDPWFEILAGQGVD